MYKSFLFMSALVISSLSFADQKFEELEKNYLSAKASGYSSWDAQSRVEIDSLVTRTNEKFAASIAVAKDLTLVKVVTQANIPTWGRLSDVSSVAYAEFSYAETSPYRELHYSKGLRASSSKVMCKIESKIHGYGVLTSLSADCATTQSDLKFQIKGFATGTMYGLGSTEPEVTITKK